MTSGIVWRIFQARAGSDGNYKLLTTLREPRPTIELKPGEYLVNAAYGRANLTKKIGVWPDKAANEDFIVNAGGLRLTATLARTPITQEQPPEIRNPLGHAGSSREQAKDISRTSGQALSCD